MMRRLRTRRVGHRTVSQSVGIQTRRTRQRSLQTGSASGIGVLRVSNRLFDENEYIVLLVRVKTSTSPTFSLDHEQLPVRL